MQRAQRTRVWTWQGVLMLLLLLGASALFFKNLSFGLPDFLYGDEGALWLMSQEYVTGQERTLFAHYSPGFPLLLAGETHLIDWLTPGQPQRVANIIFGRLTSASMGLLALSTLYAIGKRFNAPLGGLLAAAFFAVFASHVEHVHIIKPDASANAVALLAVWTGLIALEREDRWLALSLGLGLLAFVTKYTAAAAIGVAPLAALVKYWNRPRRLLLAEGGLLLAAAAVLAFLHWRIDLVSALAGVDDEVATTLTGSIFEKEHFFAPVGAGRHFRLISQTLGTPAVVIAFGLLPLSIGLHRRQVAPTIQRLIVVAGFGLAVFLNISLFPSAYIRYLMPAIAMIGVLWGLALAWTPPARYAPLAIPVALALLWPGARESWELVQWFARPDTLAAGTNWFMENVPQGARIAADGQANDLYFSRYMGYTGPLVFNITELGAPAEVGVGDLQAEGIEYMVASTVASRDYYAEIDPSTGPDAPELVKEIDLPGTSRGPEMLILKIPPYQQHVRYLWLGEAIPAGDFTMYPISLRGYDIPRTELQPGFVLEFTLYWMSVVDAHTDYVVQADLVDPDTGETVAHHESQPDSGHHPTSTWEGDMQFFRDKHLFVLPDDLPPGTYTLTMALSDPDRGERLLIREIDGSPLGDSFSLGEITITR